MKIVSIQSSDEFMHFYSIDTRIWRGYPLRDIKKKNTGIYISINKAINLKVPESHLTPRDPVTIISSHSCISSPKETKTQVFLFGLLLTDFEQYLLCFK